MPSTQADSGLASISLPGCSKCAATGCFEPFYLSAISISMVTFVEVCFFEAVLPTVDYVKISPVVLWLLGLGRCSPPLALLVGRTPQLPCSHPCAHFDPLNPHVAVALLESGRCASTRLCLAVQASCHPIACLGLGILRLLGLSEGIWLRSAPEAMNSFPFVPLFLCGWARLAKAF